MVGRQRWSLDMSLDKSLKKGGGLTRARNVLTRAERLAVLQEDERWLPSAGVFNLPKTKYPPAGTRSVRAQAARRREVSRPSEAELGRRSRDRGLPCLG